MVRLLFGLFLIAPVLASPGALARPVIAITHVNVVDVRSGGVQSDQAVVIDGDSIAAVGPSRALHVPHAVREVDGTGKYLIPGLWDMHAHNFNYVSGRPPREWQFPFFVAYGVTGVRDLWVKPKDMPLIRLWRQQLARGEFVGPRFGAVGTIVDGPLDAQPGHFPGPNVQVAATPEQGRKAVDELQAAGIDFFKPYNSLSRDVYLAVMDEARRRHFPVAGHVPWAVSVGLASQAGQASIEHLSRIPAACSTKADKVDPDFNRWSPDDSRLILEAFDEARCRSLMRTLARNHTAVAPTLVIARTFVGTEPVSFFTGDPRMATVPRDEAASWDDFLKKLRTELARGTLTPADDELADRWWKTELAIVRLMEEQGVLVLAGTDVGNAFIYPGSSLLDELGLLHSAGLTPLQTLQTATINPARFLGIENHFGSVARGKAADLVLLDGNPLSDIENVRRIRAVILNGRLFDRKALDSLLASQKPK